MKLAPWNVNSLTARIPRMLEFLDVHRPDVLFMQETKTEPGAFPQLELEATGYRAVHHSAGRWAGVALLARADLDGVCTGLAAGGRPPGEVRHRPQLPQGFEPSDHAPLLCELRA